MSYNDTYCSNKKWNQAGNASPSTNEHSVRALHVQMAGALQEA